MWEAVEDEANKARMAKGEEEEIEEREGVIRQVCGQTLARVRVRTDINSSIIISLQWRKGT